jgi:hypothetical protein
MVARHITSLIDELQLTHTWQLAVKLPILIHKSM